MKKKDKLSQIFIFFLLLSFSFFSLLYFSHFSWWKRYFMSYMATLLHCNRSYYIYASLMLFKDFNVIINCIVSNLDFWRPVFFYGIDSKIIFSTNKWVLKIIYYLDVKTFHWTVLIFTNILESYKNTNTNYKCNKTCVQWPPLGPQNNGRCC